jgi:hypothetical protein
VKRTQGVFASRRVEMFHGHGPFGLPLDGLKYFRKGDTALITGTPRKAAEIAHRLKMNAPNSRRQANRQSHDVTDVRVVDSGNERGNQDHTDAGRRASIDCFELDIQKLSASNVGINAIRHAVEL